MTGNRTLALVNCQGRWRPIPRDMIKWTVLKSVTSDPLAANTFPLALVWSGDKSHGNKLLELPVPIMKLRSFSGSLIKRKSGGKGPSSSESGLTVFLLCGERKSRELLAV